MDQYSSAFMSYARFDDEHNSGQLTNFRKLLSGEVRAHTGMQFDIFQDTSDIAFGQDWKRRICAAIDECALFMPIITPSFFTSAACRYELERFIARRVELGRNGLIIPVYYITCPGLEGNPSPEVDLLVQLIGERYYSDLRKLRGRPSSLRQFRNKLIELAMRVVAGLERNPSMRSGGIFTHRARTSSAQGTAGRAPVAGANASAKSGIPTRTDFGQGADDLAAADLLDWWNRVRQYFAAVP